jgi:hypothetical protein
VNYTAMCERKRMSVSSRYYVYPLESVPVKWSVRV